MTLLLTKFNFRTNRVFILVWVLLISVFVGVTPFGMKSIIQDQLAWKTFAEVVRTPVGLIFSGPGIGINPSIPSIEIAFIVKVMLFTMICLTIFNSFLVSNTTKGLEDNNISELILAGRVKKSDIYKSSFLTVMIANIAINVIVFALCLLCDFEVYGTLIFCLSMIVFSIFITVLSFLFIPICSSGSQIKLFVQSIFFTSFFVQGFAEISAGTSISDLGQYKWYAWLCPSFWPFGLRLYTDSINYFPFIIFGVLTVLILCIFIFLEKNRDYGTGILKIKTGRSDAKNSLKGFTSLKFLLLKNSSIAKIIIVSALAAVYGSMLNIIIDMLNKVPFIQEKLPILQSSFLNAFVGMIFMMFAILVSGFAISTVNQALAVDENKRRAEIFYAQPISRTKVLTTGIIVGIVYNAIMMFFVGLSFGFMAHFTNVPISFSNILMFGLIKCTVVIFFVSLTIFLTSINPSLSMVSYAYLGISVLTTMLLADIFKLPKIVQQLSVFHYFNNFPVGNSDIKPFLLVVLISILLIVFANIIYKKRDIK